MPPFSWRLPRLRAMAKGSLVAVIMCLMVLGCESRSAGPGGNRIRKSNRENRDCTEKDQSAMSSKFNDCINKFTQIHHENMGRAISKEDSQKYTCQMLKETVSCGDAWQSCHTQHEVRTMKDQHIQARMDQFKANRGGDVDITKCDVIKEYIDSGRADQVHQTTEGSCTNSEVSSVQSSFQSCSHNLSTITWDKIKDLSETRRLEQHAEKGTNDQDDFDEETNDIEVEEARIDADAVQLPEEELRSLLCETLMKIGHKCVLQITKCFSREDINMMREQHIKSMAGYYSSLYEDIDLSGCEALKAFTVEENDEEYNYIDEYEEYEEDGEYTGDNRDNYENYDYYDEETEGVGGSQQIAPPSLDESDKSGVTSAVTTSSKQAVTEPSPSSRESGDVAPSVADAAHQKRAPSQLPSSQLADDVSTASTASMQAVTKLSTSLFSAVIATVVAVNIL